MRTGHCVVLHCFFSADLLNYQGDKVSYFKQCSGTRSESINAKLVVG